MTSNLKNDKRQHRQEHLDEHCHGNASQQVLVNELKRIHQNFESPINYHLGIVLSDWYAKTNSDATTYASSTSRCKRQQ